MEFSGLSGLATIASTSSLDASNLIHQQTTRMPQSQLQTHTPLIGYLLWIFGFIGAHRFYYGRPISGTFYFFTLGILGIGWLIDLFLIPAMNRDADIRFHSGVIDYNTAWILLTFLGIFGIHRMYMGKWISAIIYLLTAGIFGLGYIYDFWTLNNQISLLNATETN